MLTLNSKQKELLGEWKLESSINFDEYMKEIGINAIKRALGNNTTPVVSIKVDGDIWIVAVKSTFKNEEWQFRLNERFRQNTIDGRIFWCVVSLTEDGKIIETQETIDGTSNVPSVITRYIQDGKLIAECRANNVVAKRIFVRI